jgi:glycosyltransferase involved in cell wall biosynthesis
VRIAQISALYKPNTGGMEAVVDQLSNELSKLGHEVTVFTSNYNWQHDYEDSIHGQLKIIRLHGKKIAGLVMIPGLLYALLKSPKFEIYHVHVSQAFIPETVLIAARIKNKPIILHFHLDVAPSGRFGFLYAAYKKYIFPHTLRSANKIIVFTNQQAEQVAKKYKVNKKNISVIPNAVEPQFFLNKPRKLRKRLSILYVGRLSVQKNIQQILNALVGHSDAFELNILGSGELRQKLESQKNELNLLNVHFRGYVEGKNLVDFYKKSDIFVLTSIREGMPLVLLEAMAAGLPIVANDVIGIREVVKQNKNGLLVEYNNSNQLTGTLLALSKNKLLYKKMSDNSRKMARKHSWPIVICRFEELYESCL